MIAAPALSKPYFIASGTDSATLSAPAPQDGGGIPTPGVNGSPGSGTGSGTGSGAGVPPSGSPMQSILMFALIGAVIWFLIFAPERKKREEMLGALKKGDKVVTTGGLHAQVVEVKEREVVLKAGETRLTFSRSSIHEIVGDPEKAVAAGDAGSK